MEKQEHDFEFCPTPTTPKPHESSLCGLSDCPRANIYKNIQ